MLDFLANALEDEGMTRAVSLGWEYGVQGNVDLSDASPVYDEVTTLLVKVAADRDRAAFSRLFQHYAPRVKAYMRKLGCDGALAEDLAQEAMLQVWRKSESYDPALASPGTWIFTIARNLRIDRIRRERRPEIHADDPLLVPLPEPRADDVLATRQSEDRLRRAVAQLPLEQADVVGLSFYEDTPHAEIAARLGIPLGTVKSRLRLAMNRIRLFLGDELP